VPLNAKAMTIKILIPVFLLCAIAAQAAESQTQVVPLEKTPAAVQKQIKSQLRDGTLDEIEREDQDGEVSYTVSLTRKNGDETYFTITEDGSLLSTQVQLKELPPAIQKTINTHVGAGALDSIEKAFDDGEISYDVVFTRKDGTERSFTLDSKGTLTSLQVALEQVPAPVRKAVEAHSAQGKPGDIFKLIEDGDISYSVELQHGDEVRELVVAADGKMESLQKFVDELPEAARKTIHEKIGSGKILRIDKSFVRMQGVEPFRVEARKEGKLFIFNVGPKGRFLGQED
jgi:uncharacterized membrane protein YkoI